MLARNRQPEAVIVAEPALDPLTDAVIAAARQVGRVLIAGAPAEIRRRVPADGTVPGGSRLAGSIRALQRDGHVVVLIGERNDTALASAACGFGVLQADRRPPWGAHLVGGPGLETAWLLLEAATVAKAVSRRSTLVAAQGSAAGALLANADLTPRGTQRGALATGAALTANVLGAVWSARGLGRRAAPVPAVDVAWHTLPVQEIVRVLATSPGGISEEAAEHRLRADAPADETTPAARGLFDTVMAELDTPLTLPLAAGAGVSAMIGAKSDAVLVVAVILANALLSGVQDVAARRALSRLVRAAAPRVRVRRAGVDRAGSIDELVPGDVILLEPGDAVPADCRLIDTSGLEMDESSPPGRPRASSWRRVAGRRPVAALGSRCGKRRRAASSSGCTS